MQAEGKHRRFGEDGPRLLEDIERYAGDRVKVVNNPADQVIHATMKGFEPPLAKDVFDQCQRQLDKRGKNQRGISRSKDLSRYPLSLRVFDGSCGSVMYGRTSGNRALYTCSAYQKHGATACQNNQVDADALMTFTLQTLKQKANLAGGREALRERLMELAKRSKEVCVDVGPSEHELLTERLKRAEQELKRVTQNLALAEDDAENQAIKPLFREKRWRLSG